MERSNTESKYILAGFLKFMGLDLEKIVKGRIENRIKAQKFVYFGEKLEVPLGYDFDIYLYGPYSSKLADDYYNISREEWEAGTIDLSEGEKRTLHYLKEKDALFMEVAATFDSLKSANNKVSNDRLIDMISSIKTNRLKEKGKNKVYMEMVVKELSQHELL